MKPVKSYRQKVNRKDGWSNCSDWYKPNRGPGKIGWVLRISNASAGFSFTAGRLYGRPDPGLYGLFMMTPMLHLLQKRATFATFYLNHPWRRPKFPAMV